MLEYQKYVKKQHNEKVEHRSEFITKAKEHNTAWAMSNKIKANRLQKKSMNEIFDRQVKSQETDRNRSINH